MKRSQSTVLPKARAGLIVLRRWLSRAAFISSASASGDHLPASPDTSWFRMASASGDPPGSRVLSTSTPFFPSAAANLASCVVLPVPSPPSKVIKSRPAIRLAAERHDDETVEGAFPSAVDGSNVLTGHHCLLGDGLALDKKPDFANLSALFDGRDEGPLVGEFDLHLSALLLRECDAHLVAGNERRCPDGATPDADLADGFALIEGGDGLELAETPVEKLLGLLAALSCGGQTGDDEDQPALVAHGRADKPISRLFHEARLYSVGARIVLEQRVAVGLVDVVPGEGLLPIIGIVIGESPDDVLGQERELAHGNLMVLIIKAGRILEGGTFEAHLARAKGHQVGKRLFCSGDILRNRYAGIVCRLDDRSLDEIAQPYARFRFEIHG